MRREPKAYQRLTPILDRPSFTTREARERGVSSRMLCYFVERGLLERLARGIYRKAGFDLGVDFHLEGLVTNASTLPNGVICLISALAHYGMTDEIPRENWIAIPHTQRAPRRPHLRAVRMRNLDLGRTSVRLGSLDVPIFDRERCVVDAFRYLSIEVAVKALRAYFQSQESRPDFDKLLEYAKILGVKIRPYVLALTA